MNKTDWMIRIYIPKEYEHFYKFIARDALKFNVIRKDERHAALQE